MIQGDLTIDFEGTELAAIKDAVISVTHGLIPKDGGDKWHSFTTGIVDWECSGSILQKVTSAARVTSQNDLEFHALAGTQLSLTLTTPYSAVYTGEAIMSEFTVDAEFNSVMSGTFSFMGVDELTLTE